jgi:alpha-1,2-fucosyltransferase
MKIVCIKGGLGNQLFEYCRYHGLLRQHNNHDVYLHYDRRRTKQHGGVWLDKAFQITLPNEPWRVKLLVLMLKTLRRLHLFKRLYREEDPRAVLIDDYSQHKQHITNAAEILKFRPFEQVDYADEIQAAPFAVSVHVRRGDYLLPANKSNFGVCSVHYYLSAAVAVRERHPEARFFVFSDDMEWAKENLNLPNCVFVEHAQAQPDHADLYLMSLCKGHIIANSTFSFWGAYLSKGSSAIAIYPKQWFAEPTWNVPDIFPAHWMAL